MTSWAKMAAELDSNPKIRKAGRNGREVFLFVIRRNAALDLGGRVPMIHVEGWYLSDQLMMPEPDAVSGLSQCLSVGLLARDEGYIVIAGWDDEWSKRPLTEAERKRKQRAKTDTSEQESGHVTEASGHVQTRPECHGSEEKREEEKRGEKRRARKRSPESPIPSDWSPTPEHTALAQERHVDLALEARQFRAHAEANDRRVVRWNAAFTQWLLKSRPQNSNRNGPPRDLRAGDLLDLQLQRVAEAEQAERERNGHD